MKTSLDTNSTNEVKSGKKPKIILNEQQKIVYQEVENYVHKKVDYRYLIIEGYAGTGKTFLIGEFIRNTVKKNSNIHVAMTAPTNKAVRVLRQQSDIRSANLSFVTIHKLLGLKPQITDDGKQVFVSDLFEKTDIWDFDLIIIDEASMIADELFMELEKHDKKVIFMGDPAQIPPVNEKDSIPMKTLLRDKYKIHCVRLTEIMRQAADNPIIKASFYVRNNIDKQDINLENIEKGIDDKNHGVEVWSSGNTEQKKLIPAELNRLFCGPEFKHNANHGKVIAWTNELVDRMNKYIRKIMYGENAYKIVQGEKLIADSPIVEKNNFGKKVIFNTNEEFEVLSYTIEDYHSFDCYLCKVLFVNGYEEEEIKTIRIIHEDSIAKYRNKLRAIAAEASTSSTRAKSISVTGTPHTPTQACLGMPAMRMGL